MAKNSIDNKRPLYRVFHVSFFLSQIRQKVGGVDGVRIVPVELCETRQSFAHFNRSIRGEGGEVTFCFSLLLLAFPFPPPQRVLHLADVTRA